MTFTDDNVTYKYDTESSNANYKQLEFTLTKEDAVPIDETNFPDAKFRQFVLDRIDKDDDNLLSQEEIDATASLEIQYKGISDLKGIEFFTELETLYCDGNNLSQFDLSKNTKLKDLDFDSNNFSTVDLGQYKSLEKVSCKSNNMQEIGISGLAALKELDCSSNKLTALDVPENAALESLTCNSNQISSLDVSGNPALKTLICNHNQITALDVSGNPALETLLCNRLTIGKLDLSSNPELYELNCSECGLATLDISQNPKLGKLTCSFNNLTYLNTANNPELTKLLCSFNTELTAMDVTANPLLNDFQFANCAMEEIDLSQNHELATLNCQNNKLRKLDLSANTRLASLTCANNHLVALDLANNPSISFYSIKGQKRTVAIGQDKKFDLSQLYADGFEIDKASEWSGCNIEGSIITFTGSEATYKYDTQSNNANYRKIEFTLIPETTSGVYSIDNDAIKIWSGNMEIHISGTESATTAKVYTTDGKLVYSGKDTVIPVKQEGIYIVNTSGKSTKLIVE